MGAAPSAELLRKAPFRSTSYGASRILSLIPVTPEFFSSPDSPLFEQLYESRFDPYVRYYTRDKNEANIRLDSIPSTEYTREEYYEKCMNFTKLTRQYQTNEELRNDYTLQQSHPSHLQHYQICPVPCAVVFQYDNHQNAPDGCAMVNDALVKVIGGVGCVLKSNVYDNEEIVLKLTIFLRKSAGDHNMVRAMMLAACVFYEHSIYECKLSSVPLLPVIFRTLKTNVPFLCFLREIRNRVCFIDEEKDQNYIWVDGNFICGYIHSNHAVKLCEAFAYQHKIFMEQKSGMKQNITVSHLGDIRPMCYSSSNSTLLNTINIDKSIISIPCSLTKNYIEKQFFTLAGFIDKENTIIPGIISDTNEVYVVCINTVVYIVPYEEANMYTVNTTTTTTTDSNSSKDILSDIMTLNVKRGDILRFIPMEMELLQSNEKLKENVIINSQMDLNLKITFDNNNNNNNNNMNISSLTYGTWKVDPTIYLENVLLSFLHDECKGAREASADNPHWVHHNETGEIIMEGGFYIWRFERKGKIYYYGTVPKFAKENVKRHGGKKNIQSSFYKGNMEGNDDMIIMHMDEEMALGDNIMNNSNNSNNLSKTATTTGTTGTGTGTGTTMTTTGTTMTTSGKGGGGGEKGRRCGFQFDSKKSHLQSNMIYTKNPVRNDIIMTPHSSTVMMTTPHPNSPPHPPPFQAYMSTSLFVQPQSCYSDRSQLLLFPSSSSSTSHHHHHHHHYYLPPPPPPPPPSAASSSFSSSMTGISNEILGTPLMIYEQHGGNINYSPYTTMNIIPMRYPQIMLPMSTVSSTQYMPYIQQPPLQQQQQEQQQLSSSSSVMYTPVDFASSCVHRPQQGSYFVLPMESLGQSTGFPPL